MNETVKALDSAVGKNIQERMRAKKEGREQSIRNLKYAMDNHAKKDAEAAVK